MTNKGQAQYSKFDNILEFNGADLKGRWVGTTLSNTGMVEMCVSLKEAKQLAKELQITLEVYND